MDVAFAKDFYDRCGYHRFDGMYSQSQIDNINTTIDKIIDSIGSDITRGAFDANEFDENKSGKIKQLQYLHKRDKIFQDLVDDIKNYAAVLTGSEDLDVLNVQMFQKHPRISKPTRSHQDNAYFKVEPGENGEHAITFWLALDDIDEENGAIYYAPKTHLTPTRKHVRYHKNTTFRVRSGVPGLSLCLKEHPEELDEIQIVKAGDLLAHHGNLIHRAGKNNSQNRRRRAIGIVFIPKECEKSERLTRYHNTRLKEDIELQKIKNPTLYEQLKEKYSYLFTGM